MCCLNFSWFNILWKTQISFLRSQRAWGHKGHFNSRLFIESQARKIWTNVSPLFGSWMTWPLFKQYVLLFSNPYCRIIHLAPLCWPLSHSSPTPSTRTFCDDGIFYIARPLWEPLTTPIYWALEMWPEYLRKWIVNSNELTFDFKLPHVACVHWILVL